MVANRREDYVLVRFRPPTIGTTVPHPERWSLRSDGIALAQPGDLVQSPGVAFKVARERSASSGGGAAAPLFTKGSCNAFKGSGRLTSNKGSGGTIWITTWRVEFKRVA